MTKSKSKQRGVGSIVINIVLVFIIIIAVNVIASGWFFRIDITENKLYTLSEASQQIIGQVKTPITLKYYFSKSAESLPLNFKIYGNKIEELLREYQSENEEMITLEVYDPKPDSDEEEWAKKFGLQSINLNYGESLIMGLVGVQEDREVNIPMFDPKREQFLEYDISQLVMGFSKTKNKVIGLMTGLPVMGTTPNQMQQMQGQRGAPKWIVMGELEKSYKIEPIETTVQEIPEHINMLIVMHPKKLSDVTEYAIDQFVMRGGQLTVLVDPSALSDQAAAMAARMGQMAGASSDLPKLFKHWGIEYESGKILGDKKHATQVRAGDAGVVPYVLWQSLDSRSFNQEMIATKELDKMLMVEPGGFTVKEDSKLTLNSLIRSSTKSGLVNAFMTRYSRPLQINKELKEEGAYNMAGILTGELTSAFDKRPDPPKEAPKEGEPQKEEPPKVFKPHQAKSAGAAKILLIADTDFINDQFAVERSIFGVVPTNDNLIFFINMLEFLDGAEELMAIRSRGRFSRPFTKFIELQESAQANYQEQEEKLSAQLKDVQEGLSKLTVQKGTNKVVLSKEQIESIKNFRKKEKETQSELREIRKLLRQDIESVQTFLTLLNLFVVPLLLAVFGVFLYFNRFRNAGVR